MAGPKSLQTRLRTRYQQDGLVGVLGAVPSTLYGQLRRPVRTAETEFIYRRLADDILTRDELRRRSRKEGCGWRYASAETFSIEYPVPDALPESLRARVGTYQRPDPVLTELTDATLLWRGAPAVSQQGEVVLETVENDRSILRNRIRYALRRRGLRNVLGDITSPTGSWEHQQEAPAFLLIRHPTTNFYHWMAEYLPKLEAVERYERATGERPVLLIEPDPPDWVSASLELMGYNESDWAGYDRERATVDRLLVPMHRSRTPGTPAIPSPDDCEFVRSRAARNLTSGGDFPPRVFVSRQRAADRRLQNYEEVRAVLGEFGFEPFVLEEMTLRDQIRLFSGAETVVAPHGAGLVHLLFANNPSVVELFPAHDIPHHYFCLARMLGFDYEYLIGEQAGADMVVDPERLRRTVASVVRSN